MTVVNDGATKVVHWPALQTAPDPGTTAVCRASNPNVSAELPRSAASCRWSHIARFQAAFLISCRSILALPNLAPTPEATDPSGPAILVVDDSSANLVAIEAALLDLRGQVVQAHSGEEALRLLLERDFAVVLLDVQMPALSGIDTARMIRERKRSRHTPIIFITAHSRDDRDVLAAYQLGAVDFLFKPVAPEVLRAKTAVFVELQRRASELERQARLIERHEQARKLEEERRRWNDEAVCRRIEELAEMNRHKDEFLAILAHELRNPLAPIVAGLEILRLKLGADGPPRNDEVVSRARQSIERQVEHLRRLVDDLLDVARISSGKIELRKTTLVLQEIVRQAVATSTPAIQARRHVLAVDLPDEPIMVLGDAVRLTQVFANLLNNAAQYTDDRGTIQVRCVRQGSSVEVHVVDNGRGIDLDLAPRLFEMFAQARPSQGLGLGLTIVRRLTEMHGGTVSVCSAGPSQGSDFAVSLPVAEGAPGTSLHPDSASARRLPDAVRPLVIAVIDDNQDVRLTMKDLMEELGHTVVVAGDGETGAALILSIKPDVALVDIGMPVVDGHGVANRVRAAPGGERIRLVAMSGYGTDADRELSREAGFDDHLIKPCDLTTLMKALSNEE